MANLQKHRAHESLNVDTAAKWDVQTRLTITDADEQVSNVTGVHQIGVHSDSIVYFRFDTTSGDSMGSGTNDDLRLPADTLTFIKVPQSVGANIYAHFKQVTSAGSSFLRIVHL